MYISIAEDPDLMALEAALLDLEESNGPAEAEAEADGGAEGGTAEKGDRKGLTVHTGPRMEEAVVDELQVCVCVYIYRETTGLLHSSYQVDNTRIYIYIYRIRTNSVTGLKHFSTCYI